MNKSEYVKKLKGRIAREKVAIKGGGYSLGKIQASTRIRIYQDVVVALTTGTATVDETLSIVQDYVNRKALSAASCSTNPLVNLESLYELQAYAELLSSKTW